MRLSLVATVLKSIAQDGRDIFIEPVHLLYAGTGGNLLAKFSPSELAAARETLRDELCRPSRFAQQAAEWKRLVVVDDTVYRIEDDTFIEEPDPCPFKFEFHELIRLWTSGIEFGFYRVVQDFVVANHFIRARGIYTIYRFHKATEIIARAMAPQPDAITGHSFQQTFSTMPTTDPDNGLIRNLFNNICQHLPPF